MLVKDWMSEPVITLEENTPIIKAIQVLKEHKIRRIPVTRDGKLVGIVTDRDIKEAAPSKSNLMELHEQYYLLSELKLKDIMTKELITVSPDDTIEYAAVLMLENKISGLPIVDKEGHVVGIITQTDIFKLFVKMIGVYQSPEQLALVVNSAEDLCQVISIFKKHRITIYSVLSWKEEMVFSVEGEKWPNFNEKKGRYVFLRFSKTDPEILELLLSELKEKYYLLYHRVEDIHQLPKKNKSQEED
jgi:acetoin utilization protein AcuB